METVRVSDETTEGNECEIPVAKKNFQINFGGESLEGKVWLKIAQLGRTASGVVTLNESYVAPSVAISASDSLIGILHRILEVLAAKSTAPVTTTSPYHRVWLFGHCQFLAAAHGQFLRSDSIALQRVP